MRYQIQASIPENDLAETHVWVESRTEAEILFRFSLNNRVRPIRLIDTETDAIIMKVENGIRTNC